VGIDDHEISTEWRRRRPSVKIKRNPGGRVLSRQKESNRYIKKRRAKSAKG